MKVGGRQIDGVVQLTKQGFAFVFDRVTGKPVWPIEERPVPQSDVAGEHSWPTQPFPTRPAAIAPQGMSLEEAFDLTPELKSAAQAELRKYRLGPLYTPPSVQGTFQRPGVIGGANWGGAAFDPDTAILYVKTSNEPAVSRIVPADHSPNNPRASEVDADFIGAQGNAGFTPPPPLPTGEPAGLAGGGAGSAPVGRGGGRGMSLPLVRPPYGEVVAIALNTGEIAWRVPIGDTPSVRNHPALKGVALPDRLGAAGAWGILVTKSGLVIGGADTSLYALDTTTGRELARIDLQRRASATPLTYRARSGRQFLVIATGSGNTASLVALSVR
jgi:quinoprotein glucose dehydrogenase